MANVCNVPQMYGQIKFITEFNKQGSVRLLYQTAMCTFSSIKIVVQAVMSSFTFVTKW